jgi:hypothetical protein
MITLSGCKLCFLSAVHLLSVYFASRGFSLVVFLLPIFHHHTSLLLALFVPYMHGVFICCLLATVNPGQSGLFWRLIGGVLILVLISGSYDIRTACRIPWFCWFFV